MNKITVAQTATRSSGGMCYAIHLPDDSFIVIDGGQADIDGADSYTDNRNSLIRHLKAHSKSEKPVISAWFITHFHCDHVDMATRFIKEESGNFDIRLIAYNSPGNYEKADESTRSTAWNEALSHCTNAEKRILKTGEIYEFTGAKVKVLMAEDFRYHIDAPSQNHISAAFMIELASGKRFCVLGDCDTERLYQMRVDGSPVYQSDDDLRCDILQVPHHGLPLGSKPFIDKNLELYKIMEPEICFFSVEYPTFITRKKFYDNPFYSDNYYLLTTRKKNCYHNSRTTVVDTETLEVSYE